MSRTFSEGEYYKVGKEKLKERERKDGSNND